MYIAIIVLLSLLILLVLAFGTMGLLKGRDDKSGELVVKMGSQIADTQDKIGKYQTEKLNSMDTRINRLSADMNVRLERLSHSMGEMQSLAGGVEELRKTLSNVKTRGILGEWQLGAILSEIMSNEQYEENVCTVPNTRNPVEFAIKLPAENGVVYLPIDSKFPLDAYYNLLDAYESADLAEVDSCAKLLIGRVDKFAKDIKEKYIAPPHTTDFGILFVPIEGLYAELVKRGMCETLQTKYKISLAGPSNLAALLNALQMGFKTLAVNEKADDIWHQLMAIKGEFEKFNAILEKAQQHIALAEKDINDLMGVRTRQILREFEKIER